MFYSFENVKHGVCICNVTAICWMQTVAPGLRKVDAPEKDVWPKILFDCLSASLRGGRRAIFRIAPMLSFLFFNFRVGLRV
jgi:hypothetical protein